MAARTIAELFDLTGKSAIVTGGAMGIGQAICFRLAEAGASVMIADIDLEAANLTMEAIKAKGGEARVTRADTSRTSTAREVVQATVEAFSRLDILVNNAGIYPFSTALELSEQMWDRVLSTNLKGGFFYSQAAAQEMIKAGHGGKIINVASVDALRPHGQVAHYSISKAGVVMLTKALALELAPHDILVNTVVPGTVKTPGVKAARAALRPSGSTAGQTADSFEARLPLRRLGEPDDIAKVVLFLASAAADYMTGSLVLVDGGFLLS